MTLSKEVKANAKRLYTLAIREDKRDNYSEDYIFLSLDTLMETVKTNLADDYSEYDVYNGMDDFNPASINENLSHGYGTTLALKKVKNETSSIFEELKPKKIWITIGSLVVY